MITILVPLLVAVVGLITYALAANPKMARIGEVLFAVGLFWSVALVAHDQLKL